jgi:hypothetical protein
MTPPAATTTPHDAHPTRRRRPPQRPPRRVSGPAGGRRARSASAGGGGVHPGVAGIPRRGGAAVAAPPLAVRLGRAAARIGDARFLDRLVRGRAWIALIAAGLMGIVFVQVSMLRLNAGISRAIATADALQRQNSALRGDISRLDSGERIGDTARALGMAMPPAGSVHYVDARKANGAAAARAIRPPKASPPTSTASTTAAVAPVVTASAPVAATATPTTTSAAATTTPATTQAAPTTTQAAPVTTPPATVVAPAAAAPTTTQAAPVQATTPAAAPAATTGQGG